MTILSQKIQTYIKMASNEQIVDILLKYGYRFYKVVDQWFAARIDRADYADVLRTTHFINGNYSNPEYYYLKFFSNDKFQIDAIEFSNKFDNDFTEFADKFELLHSDKVTYVPLDF